MNLDEYRERIRTAPPAELPGIIGELAELTAEAQVRLYHGGKATPSPEGATQPNLVNAAALARLLNVPESAVRFWGRAGRVPIERLGRFVRYDVEKVRSALADNRADIGIEKKPRKHKGKSTPLTGDLLVGAA